MKFTSTNHYIKYKLYDHLNSINSSIFNSGYTFLVPYVVTGITSGNLLYYDKYNDPDDYIYGTIGYDKYGTLIKISGETIDVNYFRKNTYLNIISGGLKYKTLIIDLVPNEHIIIETYKSDPQLTIDGLETIYGLKDISDILYDNYINDDTFPRYIESNNNLIIDSNYQNYYRKRKNNHRKDISNSYAKFISEDTNIINQTTAILMFDDEKKFILKIYDPENKLNGGVIRLPSTYVPEYINSGLTSKSAKIYGEILDDGGSSIIERGVCYSKNLVPKIETDNKSVGFGTTQFYSILINLEPNTTYYYNIYAINKDGVGYGETRKLKTLEKSISTPTVYTIEQENTIDFVVNSTSISGITSVVADTGYVLDTSNPYLAQDIFRDENYIVRTLPSGGFYSLDQGLEYWIAVFPDNSYYNYVYRVGDGDQLPTPDGNTQWNNIDSITGNIAYNLIDGKILERGFCYVSGTSTPTIYDQKEFLLVDNGKAGENSYFITSLTSTYTFRSYAINENGISYGESMTITL